VSEQRNGSTNDPGRQPPNQRPIVPVWLFLAAVVVGSTVIWLLARATTGPGNGDSGMLLLAVFAAAFAVYVASRYIGRK
jgi:hypothetical protein